MFYVKLQNGKYESHWLNTYGSSSSKGSIKLDIDFSSYPPKLISFSVNDIEISSDVETNIIEGNGANIMG